MRSLGPQRLQQLYGRGMPPFQTLKRVPESTRSYLHQYPPFGGITATLLGTIGEFERDAYVAGWHVWRQ